MSESATKYLEIMSKLTPELDIQIPLDLKKIKLDLETTDRIHYNKAKGAQIKSKKFSMNLYF